MEQLQKVYLEISDNLHALMKEYAKRKRIKLGLAYEHAINELLRKPDNYMGSKRQIQLKGKR